ncbi:MAG: hypothetical protein COA79_08805 [Planctomycetota bacterium]|nr:MAG: hypothetical protein COA79_08805 [Planctomycetota bacterium]
MAESIQITSNPIPNAEHIHHMDVKGRIDAYTVGELEEMFEDTLEETNAIILTLSEVDYVNSTGVGLLVKYHDKAEANGGNLIMTEIPDKVEVVFNMLGLLDFFNVYQTLEASIKAFNTSSSTGKMPEQPEPRDISEIPADTSAFPLLVKCLVCKKNIKFDIRGYYRCPNCSCHYVVTDDGKARGFKNLLSQFVELRIPCNSDYFDTASITTRSILEKTNLPSALSTKALNSFQKLFTLFTKKPKPTIDLIFVFNQTSINIGFLSTEDLISKDDSSATSVLKEVKNQVTSIEVDTTSQGAKFCRICVES